MILIKLPEPLHINLSYYGPSVDDGTMPAADAIAALQGLAGAYGKIASRLTPGIEHQLRVSAVKKSSFEMELLALVLMSTNPNQAEILNTALEAGKRVVAILSELIGAKKHLDGCPIKITITGDNNQLNIADRNGALFNITEESLKLLEAKVVDGDLRRIASPLQKGQITKAKLSTTGLDKEIEVEIGDSERSSFDAPESAVITTSKPVEIEGIFVSLNKDKNTGRFRLTDGTSVPYDYDGPDPYGFHFQFAQKGSVRIQCDASFDQNLQPSHLKIHSAQPLQQSLFQTDSSSDTSQT